MVASHVEVVVTPGTGIQSDLQQAGLVKAEVDGAQALEAADEEASGEKHYERKRDLNNDERFAELCRGAAEITFVLL